MNTNETKKRPVSASAVVRIVIWSVVLCLLTGFFVGGMMKEGFGGFFTGLHIGGYSYDDKGFSVGNGRTRENITELSIDWLEGSVTVREAEGDEIVITEDYDGEKGSHRLRWRIEDGELTIKYCKPRRWGSFDIESKNLIVEIPGTMLEVLRDAEIIAVDCDVTYEGNADELSLDMVDGDLTVNGNIGELSVHAVQAQVTYKGAVRSAEMDCVAADVSMYLDMAAELEFDQVDGDVVLYLSSEIGGFSAEIASLAGDLEVNGFEDVTYPDSKMARRGDGSLRIDVSGVNSKLKIEKLIEN